MAQQRGTVGAMPRHSLTYADTFITVDARASLLLYCTGDRKHDWVDMTDLLAFLVHAGKTAHSRGRHPPASRPRGRADSPISMELRLDRHGHVLLDGHRVRAHEVLRLAAAGLEGTLTRALSTDSVEGVTVC